MPPAPGFGTRRVSLATVAICFYVLQAQLFNEHKLWVRITCVAVPLLATAILVVIPGVLGYFGPSGASWYESSVPSGRRLCAEWGVPGK